MKKSTKSTITVTETNTNNPVTQLPLQPLADVALSLRQAPLSEASHQDENMQIPNYPKDLCLRAFQEMADIITTHQPPPNGNILPRSPLLD